MNGFINTLLSVALSWIRALINHIWQAISSEGGGTLYQFLSANWLKMVVGLCAVCMLADIIVYFFRWRPDYVWASRWRRLKRRKPQREPQEPSEPVFAVRTYAPDAQPTQVWQPATEEVWLDESAEWGDDEPMELEWTPEEEAGFGMPQPEPLAYFRDVQAGFAPAVPPEQLYAPPARAPQPEPENIHPGLDEEAVRHSMGLHGGSASGQSPTMYAPTFRPFTVTCEPEPEKPQGAFQRFAQRARDFMALDDEQRTIRDLQSNVDISKAFHEPVYPQSFSRDEE